ncbi:MAG: phosphodiester glycosidase family protein [bacterium]|jgi:exopolysaccharide biosynthesis protein|nr:phosphodiester glycosidase family protein [bacterium]
MRITRFIPALIIAFMIMTGFHASQAQAWWSLEKVEEAQSLEAGLLYQRILYQTAANKPVRAHLLQISGLGDQYLLGVLGSYGVLFPPSEFAKQSQAIALINGGFFSVHPYRANGLIMAHGKILYPILTPKAQSCVGFNPKTLLIDWIGTEDIKDSHFVTEKPGWNDCYAALSAGPILLKNGQVRINDASGTYNMTLRAPRTAIGKTRTGDALLLVVDGRQPDWSMGVTLEESAVIFQSRGAVDALNLDGGGSSVMILNQVIVNRPSEDSIPGTAGVERPVANVIGLFKK